MKYQGSGATISDCTFYRYALWRVWNPEMPLVLFIMLNPSTADALTDDPTIRRCVNFAKYWLYGGVLIGNLYGLRSTDPYKIFEADSKGDDPVGPDNGRHLEELQEAAVQTILAWGVHGASHVWTKTHLKEPFHALRLTRSKQPNHPLYLKKTLLPMPIQRIEHAHGMQFNFK